MGRKKKSETRAKSEGFRLWVRERREISGKSQKELAEIAGLPQQLWSKIERLGVVPLANELAGLCKALNISTVEAERVLAGTINIEMAVGTYKRLFRNIEKLLKLYGSEARSRYLDLFVVREDSEPIDPTRVDQNYAILNGAKNLRMSILFRRSDPRIFESYRNLAQQLAERWLRDGRDIADLRRRFLGYHPHPDREEQSGWLLPMMHPYVFIYHLNALTPYFYDIDADIYDHLVKSGVEKSLAEIQSTSIIRSRYGLSNLSVFQGWIGAPGQDGLDPHRWVRVPWPD